MQLLVLLGAAMLASILQAWPLAILIDSLIAPSSARGWVHRLFTSWLPENGLGLIAGLAIAAFLLGLTQQLLATKQKLLQARLNYAGVLRLRNELFRRLQAMHLDFHASRPLGDTVFRLTTDTFGCQAVLGVLIGVAFAVIRIVVILALLLPRSFVLTAIALLAVPPLVWANLRFGRTLEQRTLAASGVGKSTLLILLPRFYDPTGGRLANSRNRQGVLAEK